MTARHGEPNMLGLSVFCAVLGALMLSLGVAGAVRGEGLPDAGGSILVLSLVAGAAASYRLHRRLSRMTPDERAAYWRAFDERHRENHERNVDAYVRRGKDGIG
jgi:hypothetical protein